ncbi:MAG: hypothetical protein MUF56_08775, partial [Solirubrobacteraceae bacterium]|nr:hypothetical protein [Solirubrobacteraceae bacterium]
MLKVLWRRLGRRAAGTGEAEPERPLLTVQVRAGAAEVPLTHSDVRGCETLADVRRLARERAGDP